MARDLLIGGVFVIDKTLQLYEQCSIVVFNDSGKLDLLAKAVYLDGNGGVGLEVIGFDETVRAKVAALLNGAAGGAAAVVAAAGTRAATAEIASTTVQAAPAKEPEARPAPPNEPEAKSAPPNEPEAATAMPSAGELLQAPPVAAEPAAPAGKAAVAGAGEAAGDDESKIRRPLIDRLRGLSQAEQVKRAKASSVAERTILERLYGKNVWEALLRNPSLTPPEVARISRMGLLPRPLLELIISNGNWLKVAEVRRALLSNPRLDTEQIVTLLRLMSKQELKLAALQNTYSMTVRSQARALIKSEGG